MQDLNQYYDAIKDANSTYQCAVTPGAAYYMGQACPLANPDDPSLKLGLDSPDHQKEVLRYFIKNTGASEGTFGAVKQGRIAPTDHDMWDAAKSYYNNKCTFPPKGPPCGERKAKEACQAADAAVFDPQRGFLCRWNLTSKACEARPADKINFQ
jgi:hypothetical protein